MIRPRRALPPELEPEGFSMTPMIDITFQLMIFFMLVTDMSSRQIEDLALPHASEAVTTKEPETVLNLMPDGRIRMDGRTFPDEALEGFFESRRHQGRGLETPLLIRADRSTSFEHLQKVLMMAAHCGQVTRVHLGAKPERRQP